MSAEQNIKLLNDYETEWQYWRNNAVKFTNFRRGKQYTKRESKKLVGMGLKPLVVNISRPLIAQQVAILTSSKPTWKVVPLQGAKKEIAEMCERFLVGKWNSDYADIQLAQVIVDRQTTGIGYLFIDVANFMENATFDITMERLNWKYVYPDPNSFKFDFSDAENILIRKKLGLGYAQVKFGLSERDLRRALGSITSQNPMTSSVNVIDRFSKYPTEHYGYKIKDEHKNYMNISDMPPNLFYTSKLKDKTNRERQQWAKELETLNNDGKIDLTKKKELNIYRCISVGDLKVWEGVMNIRDYPIIPFVHEMSDEATKVDGEITHISGIQEATNKFYMMTIHNAMLTGNIKFTAPVNAIKNKTQWQKTWAIPGVVQEWEPQVDLPNAGEPKAIMPGQLSSAFYDLSEDLKSKAEYQTAMFAPVRGDAKGSPETFSTTSSLQNYGTERLKMSARYIDIQMAKAGEVMIQFLQNYSDSNELLEYIDDRSHLDSGQVNPNYGGLQEIGKLNEPVVEDGKIKEFKNDARIGKYAVKVLTQPNLGTDRLIKGAFLSNMVMNKAIPATPSVIKKISDLLEIPGAQEMIGEMSQSQPNANAIKQLSQQVKVLSKQNQVLEKKSLDMAKQLEISDFRFHLEKELDKVKEEVLGAKDELVENTIKVLTEKSNGQTEDAR